MAIRTKITMKTGDVWYATARQTHATPELTVAFLNKVSRNRNRNLGTTYELATEEQYQAYRAMLRSTINEIRTPAESPDYDPAQKPRPFTPKYWTGLAPTKCDSCRILINDRFYDMKTTSGSWGFLCPVCANFGPGVGKLGTGFGQEYKRQADGRWLKIGG